MERLCVPPQGAQVGQGTKFPDQGTEFNHPSITRLHPHICKKKNLTYAYKEVSPNVQRAIVCNSKKKKHNWGENGYDEKNG